MSQNPFSDPGLGSDLLPATQQNKNPFLDPNLGKDSGTTASDLAKSVKVGVQRLPGMVAGLADLPVALATGARPFTAAADALGEATGFQPGKWADETQFSAAHEQSKKAVDAAWQDGSAADIAKAYIANPGYTANQVAESLPSMFAGGLAGRALMGVGRVAAPAARAGGMGPGIPGLAERALGKWAAPVTAGVGEGAVTAGQQMAQYQGEDQQQNALASLGAGVGTGLIGIGAGRVANALGLETAETAIAKVGTGVAKAADEVPLSLKRRVLGGMVSEALLQELPQSAQEQMWSNWAQGKPLMEGVARAGTEGAIAGGVMGVGANLRGARAQQQTDTQAEQQTDTQTGQQAQETPQLGYSPLAGTPTVFPDGSVALNSEAALAHRYAPQPVQRPSEAMGIDPSAGPLSKFAAMAVDSGTYMPPADLMQQAAPEEDPIVLQNRDRNSAASIAQMQEIAANPDYLRVGPSRDMTSGAPIVFGDLPPTAVLGRQELVVDGNGQRVGTQYAVVDAGDLIASNHADGSTVAEYATGVRGKLRSVAGNGRTAGLQAAYDRGTAGAYRQELLADAASIGVDAQALAGMQRPVLVRVMGQADVTADMGDRTNITGTQKLSPVEQAANDARRFDIANLAFDEGGNPTAKSIAGFVSSMPVSEQGDMMNPDGSPTRQAVDRLMAATFKQAYDSDELVQLYAQAADPDARAVLSAAADASGVMAALSGTEFDVRQAVADAVKMAVNASRQGLKLSDVLQNADFDMNPEAYPVATFLAQNIRSPKAMAEGLRRWGQLALQQARVAEENKYQGNLLGDPTPTLSRQEILARIGDAYNPTEQAVAGRAQPQEQQAQQEGMAAISGEPSAPVAQVGAAAQESRPRNWRTSMLGAVPVAKALGIEHKGKRLAQVVAEIDARDSERNKPPAHAQQAQAATENAADTNTQEGAAKAQETVEDELSQRGKLVADFVQAVISGSAHPNSIRVGPISADAGQRMAEKTAVPVQGAVEIVIADSVIHANKRHPDLTLEDWSRLPEVTNAFDDASLGQPGPNQNMARIVVRKSTQADGSGYGAVYDFAAGGNKGRKKLNLVTYFRGTEKSLNSWWEKNKGADPAAVPNLPEPASSARDDVSAPSGASLPPTAAAAQPVTRADVEGASDAPKTIGTDTADQTQTEAFKRWFKDSKVVDADGKPLVMYHGTSGNEGGDAFTYFDAYASNYGLMGQGAYFTDNPEVASSYTTKGKGETPTVYKVFLSIQNPIDMDAKADPAKWQKQFDGIEDFHEGGETNESWYRAAEDLLRDQGLPMWEGAETMQDGLRAMGFDGITHIGGGRVKSDGVRHRVYIAFEPTQVKSATGNNGDFDPANSDIRFSRAPAAVPAFDFAAMRAAVLGSGEGLMSPEQARAILALRRPARATKESVHAALRQLVGGLGLLPNRLGRVVVTTAAEIKRDWEPLIGPTGMESSDAGEAQGFYDPKSRTVFLIAGHINAGDELGVVAHELMHKHGQAVLGEEGWSKLHSAIEGWANAPDGSMEQQVYEEALDRVQASRPAGADVAGYSSQELFPYAVQVALEMGVKPNLLAKQGTVERWLGQVRAALRQVWDKITRKPEQFKSQDLVNLAFGIAQRENPAHAGKLDGMTGQRGGDSGESPMFSRAAPTPKPGAAGWNAPSASQWDDMVYKLQDKHIDTKRALETIRATGKAIADDLDVYLQEELYHGRAAKRTEDFVNNELQPLMTYMSSVGLKMQDVQDYLHARHAKEANAVIAQRNPKLPDGGSGMTNAEADAVLASFNGIRRTQLARAAAQVDAIVAGTRQTFVDYGLESQDTVDGWAKTFAHYVPLMREQDGDGMAGLGTGQGFSVKGREVKGRTGSTRKVVDILANIALQRERAIVRGEKNRVATALVGLAKDNPSTLWQVDVVPTRQTLDKKTGMVTTQHDPLYKQRDNVVVAKIPVVDEKTGKVVVKEHAVVFNESDARAMRMATALKNLDAPQMEGLLGATAQVTRYLAAINTQYNPIFGVTNLARDVQGAALNLASTPLAGKQRQVLGQTLSALAGIYSDERSRTKGKGGTASPWAKLWEEFQSVGGQTGYRDQFRTSADRGQALAQALDPSAWTETKWGQFFTVGGRLKVPMEMARKAMAPVFAWLDDYNTAMENGVRLAAYKTALDARMSKERAASLAKNLTTNFNRKGQSATQVGALYAFFNASVQGTARIGQTLFDMEPGQPKTLRLSSLGKKIVTGGVLLGSMQAVLLAAAGFDDEEPADFVRERNLVIPNPLSEKGYVTIPMPLGFHVLPNLGRIPTEFVLGGFKNPAEHVIRLMGLFADTFNPIGNAGLSMQSLAPTVLDPIAALAENKDFSGRKIAKESFDQVTPGHALARDTATAPAKWLAEAINWLSGGTAHTRGAFSPTPDQIDYLIGQATGGVGRELSKLQQSVVGAAQGDDVPWHKVPLMGRFYGDAGSDSAKQSAYYRHLETVQRHAAEVKGLRLEKKPGEAQAYLQKHPEARWHLAANAAQRNIRELQKQRRELEQQGAPREQVRALEQRIVARMERFSALVQG